MTKRTPKFEKLGCYFARSEEKGFHFFKGKDAQSGDAYIFKDGILWRLRR